MPLPSRRLTRDASARSRRRPAAAVVLVSAALLVVSANSLADTVVNPFAGNWSTFGGGGSLKLQAVDAATGQTAVQADGGGAGCGAPTVWYQGSYSTGSDEGQIAGCTNNSGAHLSGWYVSSSGPQHGTISVDIGSDSASFSGEYDERSSVGTGTGTYDGTFASDFPSSRRTTHPAASVAVVPPPEAWGESTPATTLAPNARVVLQSPLLGPTQDGATVSVPADRQTTLGLVAARRQPSKPGDCVYIALGAYYVNEHLLEQDPDSAAVDPLLAFGGAMLACLDAIKPQQTSARAAGGISAAASRHCRVTAVKIKRVAGKPHRHRLLGRDSNPPILTSCKATRDGVRIKVKTRTSGTSLRSVVGRRLLVGLRRSSAAHGKAEVKARFAVSP